MNPNNVGELVRKAEDDFQKGVTKLSEHVEFSLHDTLEKIYAYSQSVFMDGPKDSKNRDKPFFNIVTAAENIWYRATDIDRKNIRFKSTKTSNVLASMLATFKLRDWMRRHNFGVFLNDWGRCLSRYGSAVVKFLDKEDDLIAMVVPWNTLIIDAVDFDNNAVIEKLEMTPAQLRKHKEYDQDQVTNLIAALAPRKLGDGMHVDNKAEFVLLYEVHGELPLSYLTDNDDDSEEYVQQMHVVSFVARKDSSSNEYDDFTLYRGREKNPYMITHLIKEDGRALAKGAVENLFEAQWMVNHSMKAIKDQLDLSSKLIFQTADTNFVSRNVLKAIETGDILITKENMPITHIQNNANDITSLQNFGQQWKMLAQEITSTPDVLMGKNLPSGTAYRQAAIIQQESHSNFEIMTENKGLAIEDMMRNFVIPFLKTELDTTDEIAAVLDSMEMTRIDNMYIPKKARIEANRLKVEAVLNEQVPNVNEGQIAQDMKSSLTDLGDMRFFKPHDTKDITWKEVFKDFEWEVEVEVTDETTDKEAVMTTLSTVLQTIATNPLVLQDPNAKLLFSRILENTGTISSAELQPTPPSPMQPVGQKPQVGTGVS